MKRHPKLHGLLAEQLKALADLPDDEIDTSDIPETTDFSGFKRRDFFVRVDTGDDGRPENVEFIYEIPADAEMLICLLASIPPMLPDNATGPCAGCNRTVQFRPIAPAGMAKVCTDCAPGWIEGRAKLH
jgi:hypothetical protein